MSAILNYILDEMEKKQDEDNQKKIVCKTIKGCHCSFEGEPHIKTVKLVEILIDHAKKQFNDTTL